MVKEEPLSHRRRSRRSRRRRVTLLYRLPVARGPALAQLGAASLALRLLPRATRIIRPAGRAGRSSKFAPQLAEYSSRGENASLVLRYSFRFPLLTTVVKFKTYVPVDNRK
jgi:hypothetical protein